MWAHLCEKRAEAFACALCGAAAATMGPERKGAVLQPPAAHDSASRSKAGEMVRKTACHTKNA